MTRHISEMEFIARYGITRYTMVAARICKFMTEHPLYKQTVLSGEKSMTTLVMYSLNPEKPLEDRFVIEATVQCLGNNTGRVAFMIDNIEQTDEMVPDSALERLHTIKQMALEEQADSYLLGMDVDEFKARQDERPGGKQLD